MKAEKQPWTPERRLALVLDLLREKDTLAGLAHENHLPIQRILDWKESFCLGKSLKSPSSP